MPKEGFLGSLAYLPEDIQKFNDATEAPVTRFDTGGLLADLEIFELGKRPPNALLARGWIQVQAVVGAAGCQRWGSREEMSACLVVGRRVMTSRRYA